MLVPIDLHIMTQRRGYLSSDLALGWRIGKYIEEFFDTLGEVKIAATHDDDAAMALSYLARQQKYPEHVIVSKPPKAWDFLFYHITTGTLLSIALHKHLTTLSQTILDIQHALATEGSTAVERYRKNHNSVIKAILNQPITTFCHIRQIRCRRLLSRKDDNRQITCSHCGHLLPLHEAWDIEGDTCCFSCTTLEPAWFISH